MKTSDMKKPPLVCSRGGATLGCVCKLSRTPRHRRHRSGCRRCSARRSALDLVYSSNGEGRPIQARVKASGLPQVLFVRYGGSMVGTLIFETLHGSRAFGLARAGSDEDLKGVLVGPPAWYHGFVDAPQQLELGKDHVRYELRKFFRLAIAANPTAIEMLFADPNHHRTLTRTGQRLVEARQAFLSRRIRDTFSGYALSQLKRIRGHRGWLMSPPQAKPRRSDYGLPERTLVSQDQLGAAQTLIERGELAEADLTPNFLDIMNRERRYRQAKREWDQYQSWLANRNPARAELERAYGYDTKHAQHLVRLLRMGIEILETGQVHVRRPDAAELLAIRDGAWSYDELLAAVDELETRVELAAKNSRLPADPDEVSLNQLCVELIEEVLRV